METPKAPIEQHHSLMVVEKFVTQVWNHPLVDDRIIKHRQEGRQRFQDILSGKQEFIDCCALPVGSSVWAVDEQSDHDFLFFKGNNVGNFFNSDEFKKNSINIINGISENNLPSRHWHEFIDILFVPDDLIIGNLRFAQNLRLKLLAFIKSEGEESMWKEVETHFNMYYKDWINIASYKNTMTVWKIPGRTRKERYDNLLLTRGNQSKAAMRYGRAFENAKSKFSVPSFNDYSRALRLSKGAIKLRPEFSSQGIS